MKGVRSSRLFPSESYNVPSFPPDRISGNSLQDTLLALRIACTAGRMKACPFCSLSPDMPAASPGQQLSGSFPHHPPSFTSPPLLVMLSLLSLPISSPHPLPQQPPFLPPSHGRAALNLPAAAPPATGGAAPCCLLHHRPMPPLTSAS